MSKKQKNKELANQQRELALKSKREKELAKIELEKQKKIKKSIEIAKTSIDKAVLVGLSREDFYKLHYQNLKNDRIKRGCKDVEPSKEDMAVIMNWYDERETLYRVPEKHLEYVKNLFEEIKKRKDNKLLIYLPVFEIIGEKHLNDVYSVLVEAIADHNLPFFDDDGNEIRTKYFPKGIIDGFTIGDMLDFTEFVVVDTNQREVLTKHTQFLEKEVIKIQKETKIIKQEKKVGLTDKEIDKALEKTRREFEKTFFDTTMLDNILQSVKNNLK